MKFRATATQTIVLSIPTTLTLSLLALGQIVAPASKQGACKASYYEAFTWQGPRELGNRSERIMGNVGGEDLRKNGFTN